MKLDPKTCYQALLDRSPRFDGFFFVGVSTTGIYCRPICPAKTPRQSNCLFFPSPAAAEAAGYRPCLRCRPELAPGASSLEAGARLAETAAALIEDGALTQGGIGALAERLGVSARHLRRVFQAEFGASPIQYAQTQRLLSAKRLLAESSLPVTEIAFCSGFSSLRRFNAVFREKYRLSPSGLRKKAAGKKADAPVFQLGYRPPLDWEGLLGFLGQRAIAGVEETEGKTYRRIIRLKRKEEERTGWIEVGPAAEGNALAVKIDPRLASLAPAVLLRVKRLFDLSCDPHRVNAILGELAVANPGLRPPGAMDGFELAVRAVLGQQVSVKSARTLAARFAATFGTPVDSPFPGINIAFPGPETTARLARDDIGRLGIISRRALTIIALAKRMQSGALRLEPGGDALRDIQALLDIPGIGPWTAQYIAMRALSWPDAFPDSDYGVLKALNETKPAQARKTAEKWRPWRSYAVMHLWASLKG
ncbi:MAG: DNA-3-methyladenine glycosylase 2 [Pseudomonadota bacterium]